jgi:hypothetical protein
VTPAGLGALNKRNKTSDNYSGRKSAALSRNKNTAAHPNHSENPELVLSLYSSFYIGWIADSKAGWWKCGAAAAGH